MTDRSKLPCARRNRFKTRQTAQTAANAIAANQGKVRYPEACQHCNGWHLGGDQ
ncbi:hypothetical protein Dolphis_60 [Pseudomonas phage Dolphis]|nr:hypothetical protein Dolphis_60 [Pseudomonas phage Dolphis]